MKKRPELHLHRPHRPDPKTFRDVVLIATICCLLLTGCLLRQRREETCLSRDRMHRFHGRMDPNQPDLDYRDGVRIEAGYLREGLRGPREVCP